MRISDWSSDVCSSDLRQWQQWRKRHVRQAEQFGERRQIGERRHCLLTTDHADRHDGSTRLHRHMHETVTEALPLIALPIRLARTPYALREDADRLAFPKHLHAIERQPEKRRVGKK